jgi:hypothetical protein
VIRVLAVCAATSFGRCVWWRDLQRGWSWNDQVPCSQIGWLVWPDLEDQLYLVQVRLGEKTISYTS